jgi:hypothetical protein
VSKIALINDSHWGARSDSEIFAQHFENFYKNTFFPYIDKHGITDIIDLGDTFDKRKEINFKTLTHCRKVFFDEVAKRNIKLRIIAGNHTVYYKNTNELSVLNMLADLYPNITIYKDPTTIEIDGVDLLLLPWINSSNYEDTLSHIKNSPASCVLAHLELVGFIYQAGSVATHGMSKSLFDKFQLVLSGHYHSKSDDGRIFYLGTQYDITWADYGEKKYFHILDTSNLDLQAVENEDKIFVKLEYNDGEKGYAKIIEKEDFSRLTGKIVKIIVTQKANAILFDKFLDKINLVSPISVAIIDDTSRLLYNHNSDGLLVNDTMTIIKQTIEDIPTELDKSRLFVLMNDLYNEAQED